MGAGSERPYADPEALRYRSLSFPESATTSSTMSEKQEALRADLGIVPCDHVMPLSQAWRPSPLVQNITIWVLLLTICFFTVAVLHEELQALWLQPEIPKQGEQVLQYLGFSKPKPTPVGLFGRLYTYRA